MDLSDYEKFYVIVSSKPAKYFNNLRNDAVIMECIRAEDNLFEGVAKYYRFHERSGVLHISVTRVDKSLPIQFQHICDDNNEDNEQTITLTNGEIEKESLICIAKGSNEDFDVGYLGILEKTGARKSAYFYNNTVNHILILPIELYEKYKIIQTTAASCPLARDLLISHVIELEKRIRNIELAVQGGFNKFVRDNDFDYDSYVIGDIFEKIYGNKFPKNIVAPDDSESEPTTAN